MSSRQQLVVQLPKIFVVITTNRTAATVVIDLINKDIFFFH